MDQASCRDGGSGAGRLVALVGVAVAVVVALAGCGGSGGGVSPGGGAPPGGSSPSGSASASPLSLTDRATTAGVCAQVGRDVATAVRIGVELAAQTVTPADAKAQLQPVLTRITTVAAQHPTLPVGTELQQLAEAITRAQQVTPTDPAALRTAAGSVGSAGKDVVAACSGVAR